MPKKTSARQYIFAGLILSLSAGIASAHGVWMTERYGQYTIVYGHGSADDAYDPAKIQSLTLFRRDGSALDAKRVDHATHVSFEPSDDVAVAAFAMDNGYWSKAAGGASVNKPKTEVAGAVSGGRYLKYGVSQFSPLSGAPKAVGHYLEVVPLSDPMTLEVGDTLSVRVLLAGEPVSNVRIIPDYLTDGHNRSIRTDAQGIAAFEIRNNGLNVVSAVLKEDLSDKTLADTAEHLATYSFNLYVE